MCWTKIVVENSDFAAICKILWFMFPVSSILALATPLMDTLQLNYDLMGFCARVPHMTLATPSCSNGQTLADGLFSTFRFNSSHMESALKALFGLLCVGGSGIGYNSSKVISYMDFSWIMDYGLCSFFFFFLWTALENNYNIQWRAKL